jgi:hypothetical protein
MAVEAFGKNNMEEDGKESSEWGKEYKRNKTKERGEVTEN